MAKLFIFSAASGTGKTSLAHELMKRVRDLAFSVSHTTRAPRPGETHGVHYYFVSPEEFEVMAARGEFIEHAQVFGNRYGTTHRTVNDLLKAGKSVIFDIDWQGARAIKSKMPEVVSVFILPPSRAALAERLKNRRQDAPEVIAKRMAAAVSEISHYREFDYAVVNDDFEAALADLEAIVTGKGHPRPVTIDTGALCGSVENSS
ncbi:MAG: guanylate kinase [Gammaproteobacteria bacterium]|nr:guanylate kinase [Gammaproteobacteria bacterium]